MALLEPWSTRRDPLPSTIERSSNSQPKHLHPTTTRKRVVRSKRLHLVLLFLFFDWKPEVAAFATVRSLAYSSSSLSSSFLTSTITTKTMDQDAILNMSEETFVVHNKPTVKSSSPSSTSITTNSRMHDHTMLMQVAFATAKRRRRLPNHKQLTQQILEQMKIVTDTQEALQLLQLPTISDTGQPSNNSESTHDDHHMDDDDQVYVDALHLCSKARRHDVALAIYPELCSTEACRQMAIYACGKCPGQEDLVLHLLTMKTKVPSKSTVTTTTSTSTATIASYNTALTVLSWQQAYHLLLHDMVDSPPLRPNDDDNDNDSVLDILSCNIVLNALAKAHCGEEALELWKSMTAAPTTTATAPTIFSQGRSIFPHPDRTSWHHVMTACLSCSHRLQKQGDGTSTPEQLQHAQQQARSVYYDLFLSHVLDLNSSEQHSRTYLKEVKASAAYQKFILQNGNNDQSTIAFIANHQTYDLLARGYSKMGEWDMVRMVEGHRKGNQRDAASTVPMTAPLVAPAVLSSQMAEDQQPHSTEWHTEADAPLPSNNHHGKDDLEYQYYYFQHWTGMPKVGRGNTAYWILGTYHHYYRRSTADGQGDDGINDQIERSIWRVALQPNRNPSKNGIKLLFLVQDQSAAASSEQDDVPVSHEQQLDSSDGAIPSFKTREDRQTWKKLGYVLMINARNDEPDSNIKIETPTSTLLGLFIDPIYRKHGLSKTFLAIWLSCCRQSRLQPQTGLIRKPLLSLVLEHTFGFTPMLVSSARQNDNGDTASTPPQGVELEIYIPLANSGDENGSHDDSDDLPGKNMHPECATFTNGDAVDSSNRLTSSSRKPLDSSAKIHLYSPHGKGLKGTFSPWDLLREGIVIDSHPPPAGSRGRRIIHLMCNFVSSMPNAMLDERINNILSALSKTELQSHDDSTSNGSNNLELVLSHLELQNVFLGK